MQASRVSIHLDVYRVKKKNFDIDFPAKLGNFKTLLFFHQKKKKNWTDPTFKKSQKLNFHRVQA